MSRLLKTTAILWAFSPLLVSIAAAVEPSVPKQDGGKKEPEKIAIGPADISGTWLARIVTPAGTRDMVFKFDKAGDKYTGVIVGSGRQPSAPLSDVNYKDGELSFQLNAERPGGQKFVINYKATITGEKMKGKLTAGTRSVGFDGRRESPAEGVWKLAFVLESGQKLQPTINVKFAKEKFIGEYVGITGQKAKIEDVKFKDGEISFDAPDKGDDNEGLLFTYKGKLAGDKLTGTVSWKAAGKQTLSAKLQGEKSKVQNANVAGAWKLKVPVKNGPTFEPTLTLSQNGSTVTGTYTGENGNTPIAAALILGDELSFDVSREKDGKSYKLRYQAKVKGDTLKGNVDYNFDGMSGYFEFEGTRIAPAPKP